MHHAVRTHPSPPRRGLTGRPPVAAIGVKDPPATRADGLRASRDETSTAPSAAAARVPAHPIGMHRKQSNAAEEVMTEEQTEGQEKGSQAVQESLDRRDNGGPTGRFR